VSDQKIVVSDEISGVTQEEKFIYKEKASNIQLI
jgi:hypothetical protein